MRAWPSTRRERGEFLAAYLAGTPGPLPAGRKSPRLAGVKAAAPEGFALSGRVLTPDRKLDRGWVTVAGDGTIAAVGTRKPTSVPTLETSGVILPGLLDLHGHPEFNVFAPWEAPKLYANRYRWRASTEYHNVVRDPQNKLTTALPSGTQLRYAEIRALVGGVTAIQGASGTNRSTEESLVRNVDLEIFGQHRARSMIDLPSSSGRSAEQFKAIKAGITAGEVTAFYLHLAEGQRGDKRSLGEFSKLVKMGGLTPATILIHGSALTKDELGAMKDAGAKLIWSPQSNLRLYAETTRADDALRLNVPLALGSDWLPSGSTSLLAEMKVARRWLAGQGFELAAKDLVRMVTADAAAVAGLGDHLGTIEVGRAADLLVLDSRHADPYENVCLAEPSWVQLVTIGGDLAYGRTEWVRKLAPQAAGGLENVVAWGQDMLLDTSFEAHPDPAKPSRRLAELRTALVSAYPPVGPIFA